MEENKKGASLEGTPVWDVSITLSKMACGLLVLIGAALLGVLIIVGSLYL